MPIKPIDLQVLMPKVSDIGKLQQSKEQVNFLNQQENINQINQETFKNTSMVNKAARGEASLVHEREDQEKSGKKFKNKQKNDENKNKHNAKDNVAGAKTEPGSTIDIKI